MFGEGKSSRRHSFFAANVGNSMQGTEPSVPSSVNFSTTGGTVSPQAYEPPPPLPSQRPNMLDLESTTTYWREEIKEVVQQKIYADPYRRPIRFMHSSAGRVLRDGRRGTGYNYWRCIMHSMVKCPYKITFITHDTIRPRWKESAAHSHYSHSHDCNLNYQQYIDRLASHGKRPPKWGPAVTRMVSTLVSCIDSAI